MKVTIEIPSTLGQYCGNASELVLSAATVRAALDELERSFPLLYPNICDETGRVRRHLNIFVNTSHIRDLEGLETRLADGDVVIILPAVSGG